MKKYIFFLLLLCIHKNSDAQSEVSFSINNFGIATKGTLSDLKTTIVWNPQNLAASSFQATVASATINTGIQARDHHLKKSSYFDVAQYPVIAMNSNQILAESNNEYIFDGTITIKGKSQKISFPFSAKKIDKGYLFEGNFEINRRDFNVGGNSLSLSDKVRVLLKVSY